MIKANELRIGNLVSLNGSMDSVTHKIVAWTIVGCNEHNCSIRLGDMETIQEQSYYTINPIPLIPEILEKAGFEKNIYDESILTTDTFTFIWVNDHLELHNKSESDYWDNLNNIKSLHQLQNLYFALMEEELTIDI